MDNIVKEFSKLIFCPVCHRELRGSTSTVRIPWRVCLYHGRFDIQGDKIVWTP
jgi:C4-type Zn-finger protein